MKDLKIVKDGNGSGGLMTVEQAGDFLGVPKSSIYQMVFKRKIPFVRIGKRLRFKRCQLDEFVNQNSIPTGDYDS